MAALKEEEFDAFLKRRLSSYSSLLIHGDDEAAVSSMGAQAIAGFARGNSTASIVDEIDASACKKAPGVFSDALYSMSLLGDRRLLVLEQVDDSCISFLAPLFDQKPGGNFVLLKAQGLKRDSRLRAALESGPYSASVAVFPDDRETASARARALLLGAGLGWGESAETAFFDLVGFERSIVGQELAKLMLYCHGAKIVETEDVAAICGDLAEDSLDDVVDAMLSGDLPSMDRNLADATGRDAKAVLPLLSLHLSRLVTLKSAMSDGHNADHAVRSARPPIFFKRRSAVVSQLNRLSLEDLAKLQTSVQTLSLRSRQLGEISSISTARSLLSLARNLRPGAI